MSGSPVVLIATEVPTALVEAGLRMTLHQSKDQASMFRSLAKGVFTPRTPQTAADDLAEAITTALSAPQGPVYVDLPADLLGAPEAALSEASPEPAGPPDVDALQDAAQVVNAARSVVIWAGGGAVQAEAGGAVAALAELLKAPVVTTFAARGLLGHGDPHNVALPPHEPEIEQLLASADVLIALGTDFDGMMTKNATLKLPPVIIDINVDLRRTQFGYEGVFPVVADARVAVDELLQLVGGRQQGLADGLADLKARVWSRLRSDARTAEACTFVTSVERATPYPVVVVNDMTIPGYWLGNYSETGRGRSMQYPIGWGTLGYALPASVGAALGGGCPVLAVCGDGGFMFAVGELATIAQERLPITVLLVDDGGYGMLRYDSHNQKPNAPWADLRAPDFVQLASAFGIGAARVTDVGAPLEEVLRRALASGEPRMVVCEASLFPPKTTSPRWDE
jgi:acetolactate synthase-1/2/3 large subunit